MHRFYFLLVLSGCNLIGGTTARDIPSSVDTGMADQTKQPDETFFEGEIELDFSNGKFRTGADQTSEGLTNEKDTSVGVWSSRVIPRSEFGEITTLRWFPKHLYRTALPVEAMIETLFPAGNIDMTSNSLLLQVNGEGTVPDQEVLLDKSGQGTDFSAENKGQLYYEDGVFGQALKIGREDALSASAESVGLQFGSDDFTWEMWVKTSVCTGSNNVFMGSESEGGNPHIWMGCVTQDWCEDMTGFGGGIFNDGSGDFVCGARLDDEKWHHVALVKNKQGIKTEAVYYLDGVRTTIISEVFENNDLGFDGTRLFKIGTFPTGTYDSDLSVDEIAIYKRALSDVEIRDRYRRGIAEVSFIYKFCETEDCLDNTVVKQIGLDDGKNYPRVLSIEDSGQPFFQLIVTMKGKGDVQPSISKIILD